MRKLLMSLVALVFMGGLVFAGVVEVVGYDKEKKEIKVKEGDETKTYKVDEKGKFSTTDKNGENAKDADFAAFEKRAAAMKKIDITVKDGTVTEAKWKMKK